MVNEYFATISDWIIKINTDYTYNTIKFIKSPTDNIVYDRVNREVRYYFNGEPHLNAFRISNKNLPIPDTKEDILSRKILILNNTLKIYNIANNEAIRQVILDGSGSLIITSLDNETIIIYPSNLNISLNDYITELNKSGLIYVERLNYGNYKVNFYSQFEDKIKTINSTNTYIYTRQEYSLEISDIISQFIKYLENQYSEYKFLPYQEDIVNNNDIIFYKVINLDRITSEHSTRVFEFPIYERLKNDLISIEFEYITNDIKSLINFFYDFKFIKKFSNIRTIEIKDKVNNDWSISIIWKYSEFEGNVEKQVEEVSYQNIARYSLKFNADILAFTTKIRTDYPKIIERILQWH
jgi:hypothetical protein